MPAQARTLTIHIGSPEAEAVQNALSAKQRVKLLEALGDEKMSITQLAAELGIGQSTVSFHVKILENAGLVHSAYVTTGKVHEKQCWTTFDKIVLVKAPQRHVSRVQVLAFPMPVGLFSSVSIVPPCGLASAIGYIGERDDPGSFLLAERASAQICWFAQGWVEYTFHCGLPQHSRIVAVEFSAEMCSEVIRYNDDWPSDITVWINGVDVGTWTSPGDFGDRPGKLNPDWWSGTYTQYGIMKKWRVDASGSSIDGEASTGASLSDLRIRAGDQVRVRIGIKEDALHKGGINLLGKCFGDYPNDLTLKFHYTTGS